MRRAALAVTVVLAGCGSATTHPSPVSIPSVTLGAQTYALDQLADSPDDGSGTRLLYAVIRVTSSVGRHTLHEAAFTLVDVGDRQYRPLRPSVYVPIDHLDGLSVAPGQPGAGVVAFPIPSAMPRMILVNDGSTQGVLDAP